MKVILTHAQKSQPKKEFIISLHCRHSKEIFFQVKEKGQQKATQIHMKKITDTIEISKAI